MYILGFLIGKYFYPLFTPPPNSVLFPDPLRGLRTTDWTTNLTRRSLDQNHFCLLQGGLEPRHLAEVLASARVFQIQKDFLSERNE